MIEKCPKESVNKKTCQRRKRREGRLQIYKKVKEEITRRVRQSRDRKNKNEGLGTKYVRTIIINNRKS